MKGESVNFEVFMEMMTERRRKEGGQTQKANDLALAWAPRRTTDEPRKKTEHGTDFPDRREAKF